ncbi:helix-turn-helix domain-containing protein [Sporosarcina sp.]|uniref:helix-turn-helix domain-containing protein n=1 Tax=Sporosarcina sp. TaxID=49982 RepID=UPI0026325977|nr:helix-turn-helix domain-containing protein [Sporosarcina sp.]
MKFVSILLTMFQRLHGERSASGVYHILRGKRSGQTLQDIENYQLKPFYALFPALSAADFQQYITTMLKDGLIQTEDQLVFVTNKGHNQLPNEKWRFNGWEYRGKEREFIKRLALTVQTISQLQSGETMFTPIQKEIHIQQFVKEFIRSQRETNQLATLLLQEMESMLNEAALSDVQCTILMYRLTGHRKTACTWDQLADGLALPVETIQLYFLESLHIVLDFIGQSEDLPLLTSLSAGCKVEIYLTQSAERTRKLFQQGFSIHQIASLRQLKLSTIEDHIIEMAANNQYFPFRQFISEEQIEKVWRQIDKLQTKRLRLLKEQSPELSYFELRLIIMHGRRVESK